MKSIEKEMSLPQKCKRSISKYSHFHTKCHTTKVPEKCTQTAETFESSKWSIIFFKLVHHQYQKTHAKPRNQNLIGEQPLLGTCKNSNHIQTVVLLQVIVVNTMQTLI